MGREIVLTEKPKAIRPLIQKLGLKPGHQLLFDGIGRSDPIREQARELGAVVKRKLAQGNLDVVLFRADQAETLLQRFEEYKQAIKPMGMIWALWPKGGALRRDEIREVGIAAGLVDIKVLSYSEQLSGLKFVVPVVNRRA